VEVKVMPGAIGLPASGCCDRTKAMAARDVRTTSPFPADHDRIVVLDGCMWGDYLRLLEIRGDHHRGVRQPGTLRTAGTLTRTRCRRSRHPVPLQPLSLDRVSWGENPGVQPDGTRVTGRASSVCDDVTEWGLGPDHG
jgi:hypothetical protein